MPPGDVETLVSELQVHQIELEVQNEELREVQKELAGARDLYLELYDLAPVAYLTLDGKGVIRECNLTAARILGVERSHLQGTAFARLVEPEGADDLYLHLKEAEGTEGVLSTELKLRRPGGPFWARLETRVGRSGGDGTFEYRVTFTDVTERREAEEGLRLLNADLERRVAERTADSERRALQLQRLAAQLASSEETERRRIAAVLHDGLQQDLVGLKFRLEALISGPAGSEASADALKELCRSLEKCIERTRDLSHDVSPPVLQRNGLVPALQFLSQKAVSWYGLSVELSASPDAEPALRSLASPLFTSVKELLLNVRKHSGATSASVTARKEGDRILVSVSDRGKGFDAAAASKERPSGAGIGLFSIEERLGLLGGSLRVESAPGRGCCVTLEVPSGPDLGEVERSGPRAARPLSGELAARTVGPDPVERGILRILLADDHVLTRQGLAALLSRETDFRVVGQASDGREAVHLAGETRPDVVLMDVSMPNMDGIEATGLVKQYFPKVRVIGLSMFDDPYTAAKMLQAGAEAFLCKTGSLDRLIEAVRGDGAHGLIGGTTLRT